jgi:hypothetical protein
VRWTQVIQILSEQLRLTPALLEVRMRERMGLPPLPPSPRSAARKATAEETLCLDPAAAPVMRAWCRKCRIYSCLTHPDAMLPKCASRFTSQVLGVRPET